jgi:hypothetical protein
MALQHLALKEIEEKALAALVANGACESRALMAKCEFRAGNPLQ